MVANDCPGPHFEREFWPCGQVSATDEAEFEKLVGGGAGNSAADIDFGISMYFFRFFW
jgi:hypothetical protein